MPGQLGVECTYHFDNKENNMAQAPSNWLEICSEEAERGKLTSMPQKVGFMRERGMRDLDEVHATDHDWREYSAVNVEN